MQTNELRERYLAFFQSKGHRRVASDVLVPTWDPSVLFTSAGMNQFKDYFLGKRTDLARAASSQKCLRTGDLENVGRTASHHSFFEMLGNFSFGDYFKKDAIQFAWELLTRVYGLAPERLWTTVYESDEEAYELWTRMIGVPPERCVRIGDKPGGQKYQSDNFWQMADTGPCGPCSEIFYDHGPGVEGGPPGSPDADGDRYIEIWNLVFMQFNRDDQGVLHPLPKPSVDTGMGLERLAAVLQGVHSNYEIDLFVNLLSAAKRAVDDQEAAGADVVGDHVQRRVLQILLVRFTRRRLDQVLEKIDLVVRVLALQHRGDALETHAGVDRGLGQRMQHALVIAVELHEHQVPDLDVAVAVGLRRARRPARIARGRRRPLHRGLEPGVHAV